MLAVLRTQRVLPSLRSFASLSDQATKVESHIVQTCGNDIFTISISNKGVQVHSGTHHTSQDHHSIQTPIQHGSLQRQLAATFLPSGYPTTVAPGYLKYVWWQALHHCCGSANGVLASTFMLYSVGLGAGAIPTAGALNWVLKDGIGQLGTLLFGRAIAHNFDVSSRLWYVLASLKLNVAIGLEICSFLTPQYFLAMGSMSNALKGLAWMAGGSSRSSFNVTFATDNNIADITAKATSQTICTSLIGTSAGIAIASSIGQSSSMALTCYAALCAVHLWSGYESARCVPLATLNPSRMNLLLEKFTRRSDSSSSEGIKNTSSLPSPAEVAPIDPIFSTNSSSKILIGGSLKILAAQQPETLAQIWPLFSNEKYIIVPAKTKEVHIVFHEEASAKDCILGMLHADLLLAQDFTDDVAPNNNDDEGYIPGIVERSLKTAKQLLPEFLKELERAGWDTEKVVLESKRHRARWT